MKAGIDAEIDRLYQLPLDEFTAARNALAKQSGARGADIRALSKPPVAAWAVNQLYWKRRPAYDALIDAANTARSAHAAVLAGRAGDVRTAGKEHDAQVSAALDATLEVLLENGHPATDATRQAIVTTLRALPGTEPPGRLTGTLQPSGFEALAGLSIRGGGKAPAVIKPVAKPAPAAKPKKAARDDTRDVKAIAHARESLAAAAAAVKEAEHNAQREEFERARAARDQEKSARTLATAQKALEEAQEEVRKAEAAADEAKKKKDAAEQRAQEAESALDRAMSARDAAKRELDELER